MGIVEVMRVVYLDLIVEKGDWFVVDLKVIKKFEKVVLLKEIKVEFVL